MTNRYLSTDYIEVHSNQTVYYCIFLACLILHNSSFSQHKQVIAGKVTDAQTGEGIPFATLSLKGKAIGTQSDFEGNYRLSTQELTDSLLISSVGYVLKSKPLTSDSLQTINVQLSANSRQLKEVVVYARGQDPAYRIMRWVNEHREQNNFAQLKAYQWEAYNRIAFRCKIFPKNSSKRKLFGTSTTKYPRLNHCGIKTRTWSFQCILRSRYRRFTFGKTPPE